MRKKKKTIVQCPNFQGGTLKICLEGRFQMFLKISSDIFSGNERL